MKTKYFLSLVFIFTFLSNCRKDNLSGEEFLPAFVEKRTEYIGENIGGYFIGLPRSYDINVNKSYPLILSLPGAYTYGPPEKRLDVLMSYGIPKLLNEKLFPSAFVKNISPKEVESFVIAAPQFIDTPSNSQIRIFLNSIIDNFRIDTSRIYLVGISVGARMACDFAADNANDIAALIAMGGCSDDKVLEKAQRISASNLAVWIFHNKDDEVWPIQSQLRFVSALESFGNINKPKVTIFEIPEGIKNHDAWTRPSNPNYMENNLSIYNWLLEHKR